MTQRNDTAIFGWAFMILWMGMLLVFTWLFAREGGFHQFSPAVEAGILALFWLFGLAGCFYFFGVPCVELRIEDGGAVLSERWLFSRHAQRYPAGRGLFPAFAEDKDSEGDPYFRCTLTTPEGRTVTVAEHHDRARVETVFERLRAAFA